MASGPAFKITKRNEDGTLEKEILVRNPDGSISRVTQSVFEADSPSIPPDFSDEISRLINSGEIEIPSSGSYDGCIVDISDQLASGKYTYSIVNESGVSKKTSKIFRVFLDGVNVSKDIEVSEDKYSFTFMSEYPSESFGYPNTRLIIDFEIESEEE